jgi:hypothetical protein
MDKSYRRSAESSKTLEIACRTVWLINIFNILEEYFYIKHKNVAISYNKKLKV